MNDYVIDDTIAEEALELMKQTYLLVDRAKELHERLEAEAGEGEDITDEAYERSGSQPAWEALHLAQSILQKFTGCDGLRVDEMSGVVAELWPTMDVDLAEGDVDADPYLSAAAEVVRLRAALAAVQSWALEGLHPNVEAS